jgi:hypothetical protein
MTAGGTSRARVAGSRRVRLHRHHLPPGGGPGDGADRVQPAGGAQRLSPAHGRRALPGLRSRPSHGRRRMCDSGSWAYDRAGRRLGVK